MKKFISVLSVVVIFGGIVAQDSSATPVQSGLMSSDDDVCPWIKYKNVELKPSCKQINQQCEQNGNGAGQDGVCKKFNNGELRCVARACPDGHFMPLVFESKYDVSKEQNARILGYCYSAEETMKKCEKNCAGDGVCKPKIVDYTEANKMLKSSSVVKMSGGKAFVGCFCETCNVPQGTVCENGDCEFVGDITVRCDNGKTGSFRVDNLKIDKNDDAEKIARKIETKYKDTIDRICKGNSVASVNFSDGSVGTTLGSSDRAVAGAEKSADSDSKKISAARDRLAEFFKKTDSDKSVWKNADGSFNGVRLASDLTAGVVLGTVGGVVSGVLIKKSQVEKGFDALNCTVGGQKIADWGDEFTVGMRR